MLRHQLGHQLGGITTSLLGIEVAHLLRLLHHGNDCLVVALFRTLFKGAAGATKLCWQLFTFCVTDKLTRPLLHVLCGAGGFVNSCALLLSLATAHLLNRGVALANSLVERLLVEGDGAGLLEVLLAHLLLAGLELGDVGVVALLCVLVGALQDGLLLQAGDGLLLLNTAEAGLGVLLTAAEVDPTLENKSVVSCCDRQ